MLPGSKNAFTFPEALVTIGLLLLFAVLVGGVYFQCRFLAAQQDRHDQFVRDKLSLTDKLPRLCQNVLPPEWVDQERVFETSATGLSVRYWNGDYDQVLTFVVRDGLLEVRAPQGTWTWKSLKPMKAAWWKSSDRIIGLEVGWTEDGKDRVLHLPWGGRPL